jgi:hypothetical protein
MELFWIFATLCIVFMIAMMVIMFRHVCAPGARRAACCGATEPNVNAQKEPS